MGDDWCRMRLKPTADPQVLLGLIESQAHAFQEYGQGLVPDLAPFTPDHDERALRRYAETVEAIDEQVVIDEGASPGCMSMSIIGRNPIFPYLWRIEAYRTFLPEQVPAALKKWKIYIEAVRAGQYTAYLLDWHLYAQSRRAFDFWSELHHTAQQLLAGENWTSYLKSDEVPRLVLQFPSFSTYPPPVFDDTKGTQTVDWQHDDRYLELLATYKRLHELRHAWNHNAKRQDLKFQRGDYPFWTGEEHFDQFIGEAYHHQIDDLFDWLQSCIDDGEGLYLSV
jgi:hypothetical protein